jgi:hypothetical protein
MKFQVFNETDRILASPKTFATKEAAEACADELRRRFVAQGFYLTATGERIRPEDVRLVVLPVSP